MASTEPLAQSTAAAVLPRYGRGQRRSGAVRLKQLAFLGDAVLESAE
jgi:hypothetical protein